MNAETPLVIAKTPLYKPLAKLAAEQRIVLFAGLPGVGKSLFLQQMALLAHEAGRKIHLLQWDVTRTAFETPAIMARYPEVNGVTHAAIRKAVGLWARQAVGNWHTVHPAAQHILIGEVPLIGNRLIELVQRMADDVEPLLAGEQTTFVLPVPTRAVRAVIEAARAKTTANPQHAKEAGDATPYVLQLMWDEMVQLAEVLQLPQTDVDNPAPHTSDPTIYHPALYRDVYTYLMQHRHCQVLSVDQILPKVGSVYDLSMPVQELNATATQVAAQMAFIEHNYDESTLLKTVSQWYELN